MKTSLILTIKNEGKNIKEFLESVKKQTQKPDEIVIVDSNSTDDTKDIIKKYLKDLKIKLIVKEIDTGNGRNLAIENAKYDIILVSDGGCILDKKWVEEISKPFENVDYFEKVDVVGGVFEPISKNLFEICQGLIVCKPIENIKEDKFLPSSRSLAFRKDVWKKVKYSTHKVGGEDTKFILDLKDYGFNIKITKKAIVYWRMRSPLKNFIKQFYLYAIGDVKMGNINRMKTNKLFVLGFPVFLFSGLLLFYSYYKGWEIYMKTNKLKGFYYGFILSFFKRTAYALGVWREWIKPYKGGYTNENF